MKFNQKLLAVAAAASFAAVAPVAADAATIHTTTTTAPGKKTNFLSTITYVPSFSGLLDVYLRATETGPETKVTIKSAKLNGVDLGVVSSGSTVLQQLLSVPVNAGDLLALKVVSTTDKHGFYTTEFVLTGAVPEAATWALMVLGFGAVAYSMRRRVAKTTVSFA